MFYNFDLNILAAVNIFDVVFTSIIAVLILVFMFIHIHKLFVIVSYLAFFVVYLVALFLELSALSSICQLGIIILSIACIMVNISEFRNLLSNFSSILKRTIIRTSEKKYDKKEIYAEINQAVQNFSKTKTGALMIFQKTQPLNDGINDNGIEVNAWQ